MKKFNIACVIGTRPEVLKMLPIIEKLENESCFSVKTILTGQHKNLLQQMLAHSNLCSDVNFDIMQDNQSLNTLSANLMNHFENYFNQNTVDLLIAQGDTTTTLVAALSAFYKKIPFAHVEAGLRTSCIDNPFPEEFNRRTTTMISSLHFCPTQQAAENLKKENVVKHVYVTGNTIIDMLYQYSRSAALPESNEKIILVTCHRRENFGEPLNKICDALKEIALRNVSFEINFPVHPNPNVRTVVYKKLSGLDNIKLFEPLDYPDLVRNMRKAYLVLTDSGGLQEEAPALNKPVLVLRNETERPEAVNIGAARLVGYKTQNIIDNVEELIFNSSTYEKMSHAGSPYGDGKSSKRIVNIIGHFLRGDAFVETDSFIDVTKKSDFTLI